MRLPVLFLSLPGLTLAGAAHAEGQLNIFNTPTPS